MALSMHAEALAEQLREPNEDGDHLAMAGIPSAAHAAEHGLDVAGWMRMRREELVSIGIAISELRAAGWELSTRTIRKPRDHAGPDFEAIVVEATHIPENNGGQAPREEQHQ